MLKVLALVALFVVSINAARTTCRVPPMGPAITGLNGEPSCLPGETEVSDGTCCENGGVVFEQPPCVDKTNANGVNECPGMKSYCNNNVYKTFMTQQCPKTCGFCPPPPTYDQTTTCRTNLAGPSVGGLCPPGFNMLHDGNCCQTEEDIFSQSPCVDKTNANGVNECPGMKSYCNNSVYKTLMTQQCPKTCGFCSSSSTCADLTSQCSTNAGLCNNNVYRDLMKTQCPKTCGYCR